MSIRHINRTVITYSMQHELVNANSKSRVSEIERALHVVYNRASEIVLFTLGLQKDVRWVCLQSTLN